jgi:hypothetical protein
MTAPDELWLEQIHHSNITIGKPVRRLDEVFPMVQNLFISQGTYRNSLVFRGQGNAGLRLLPSAYRDKGRDKMGKFICDSFKSHFEKKVTYGRIGNKDKSDTDLENQMLAETQIDFEYRVFREFIKEADRRGIPIPEFTTDIKSKLYTDNGKDLKKKWPPHELYAGIGFAQHYGIPTRFMDWTSDAYAALYFAAHSALRHREDRKEGNFVLWVLDTGPYRELTKTRYSPDPTLIFKSGGPIDLPFEAIYVPTLHNQNLAAQSGLYVYSKSIRFEKYSVPPTYDLVQVISDLEPMARGPYLEAIRIPISEANDLLGIMDTMGYSPSKYFPGLDGVVKTLEMRGEI